MSRGPESVNHEGKLAETRSASAGGWCDVMERVHGGPMGSCEPRHPWSCDGTHHGPKQPAAAERHLHCHPPLPVAEHHDLQAPRGGEGLHTGPHPRLVSWGHPLMSLVPVGRGRSLSAGRLLPLEPGAKVGASGHPPVPRCRVQSLGTKAPVRLLLLWGDIRSPWFGLFRTINKSPLLSCWLLLDGANSPRRHRADLPRCVGAVPELGWLP